MNIESQVTSLEMSEKLRKVGFIANAIWYWVHPSSFWQSGEWTLYPYRHQFSSSLLVVGKDCGIPAYTFEQLWNSLPYEIADETGDHYYLHIYKHLDSTEMMYYPIDNDPDRVDMIVDGVRAVDAAAEAIIWCIENEYLAVNNKS